MDRIAFHSIILGMLLITLPEMAPAQTEAPPRDGEQGSESREGSRRDRDGSRPHAADGMQYGSGNGRGWGELGDKFSQTGDRNGRGSERVRPASSGDRHQNAQDVRGGREGSRARRDGRRGRNTKGGASGGDGLKLHMVVVFGVAGLVASLCMFAAGCLFCRVRTLSSKHIATSAEVPKQGLTVVGRPAGSPQSQANDPKGGAAIAGQPVEPAHNETFDNNVAEKV